MTRILTGLAILIAVIGTALLAIGAYQPAGKEHTARDTTGAFPATLATDRNSALHDQVSLCNLLNALWLDEDQLRGIIAVLEPEMPGIEQLATESYAVHTDQEFGAAMAELRDTLMRGEEPDEELKRLVNGYAGPGHELRLDYETRRREVAGEIKPLLTENQLYILGEYKPCLFNQNDPLHPERVGQASAAGRTVESLQRLRSAPPRRQPELIERGINRLAEMAYENTPFAIDLDDEKERLRGLVNRALALSVEEFAMQAEDLAAEMTLYLDTKDQMMADHYNLPVEMTDRRLSKIAHTIVVPGALQILQAKLAALIAE